MQTVLILHNIRSVHNVGSIFRTADAAGVSKIILSGYSPTPFDRFNRERKDFVKVSLGAEKSVPWEYVQNVHKTVEKLKDNGYEILGIEQHKNSTPLFGYKPKEKVAVIMGNEVRGISPTMLKRCDAVLEIPMHGKKESLNVSVSAGIALFVLKSQA